MSTAVNKRDRDKSVRPNIWDVPANTGQLVTLTSTSTPRSEYDMSFSSAGMNVMYTTAFSSGMCGC